MLNSASGEAAVLESAEQFRLRLRAADLALVQEIDEDTKRLNRNNVTRTEAYYHSFMRCPELHWALLAHMVSRNGGWSMTDLKGDLLPHLMDSAKAETLFQFLEKANWLIFQDAYPQLLLYEKSRKHGRSLFYLLPAFSVSRFMRPIWESFWENRSSAMLTIGLIINEQHYIEQRILQDEYWKQQVVDTLTFKVQSLLQLNQVFFPMKEIGQRDVPLAGLIVEQFSSLEERIEFGKKLYAMLFGIPSVSEGARRFAQARRHTGSRADYWPHLFATVRKSPAAAVYKRRLDGERLLEDAEPFYSPPLNQAWPDQRHPEPDRSDWFINTSAFRYMRSVEPPFPYEMSDEAMFGLNKIELAVLAGEALK
nr:DUF2515 family protein [Paenibacillus turpanensis]